MMMMMTDLAKKRHGLADLYTPIHSFLQYYFFLAGPQNLTVLEK